MKAVMLSIQPKWCELIASGKKTVEVRRTKPKIDVPFKCYIYCTKDNSFAEKTLRGFDKNGKAIYYKANKGKVIGEFVCDKVDGFTYFDNCVTTQMVNVGIEGRLTLDELAKYFKGNSDGYAWHITDLVIYDKPKELSEFYAWKKCNSCRDSGYESTACCYDEDCKVPAVITRPPQSWCYCEELLPPLVEPKCKTITISRWRYNEHKGETE